MVAPGTQPQHQEEEEEEEEDNMSPEEQLAWMQEQLQALQEQHGITLTLDQMMAAVHDGEDGLDWQDPYDGDLVELLEAAQDGDVSQVTALLEKHSGNNFQAFINHPGPDGDTALHLAALYGKDEVVEKLLQAGADAGVVNEQDGSTALHDSAASGELAILKQLLAKATGRINHADNDGDTPLHNAARGGHAGLVKMLLEAGADKRAVNKDGKTPAQEAEDTQVLELLQS